MICQKEFSKLKKKKNKYDIICFFSSKSVVFVAQKKSSTFIYFWIMISEWDLKSFLITSSTIQLRKKKRVFFWFLSAFTHFFFSLFVCISKPKGCTVRQIKACLSNNTPRVQPLFFGLKLSVNGVFFVIMFLQLFVDNNQAYQRWFYNKKKVSGLRHRSQKIRSRKSLETTQLTALL